MGNLNCAQSVRNKPVNGGGLNYSDTFGGDESSDQDQSCFKPRRAKLNRCAKSGRKFASIKIFQKGGRNDNESNEDSEGFTCAGCAISKLQSADEEDGEDIDYKTRSLLRPPFVKMSESLLDVEITLIKVCCTHYCNDDGCVKRK